jgi:hypothetical protein
VTSHGDHHILCNGLVVSTAAFAALPVGAGVQASRRGQHDIIHTNGSPEHILPAGFFEGQTPQPVPELTVEHNVLVRVAVKRVFERLIFF